MKSQIARLRLLRLPPDLGQVLPRLAEHRPAALLRARPRPRATRVQAARLARPRDAAAGVGRGAVCQRGRPVGGAPARTRSRRRPVHHHGERPSVHPRPALLSPQLN